MPVLLHTAFLLEALEKSGRCQYEEGEAMVKGNVCLKGV